MILEWCFIVRCASGLAALAAMVRVGFNIYYAANQKNGSSPRYAHEKDRAGLIRSPSKIPVLFIEPLATPRAEEKFLVGALRILVAP